VRRVSPKQVKLAFALLPYLTLGELLDPLQLHRPPPVFGLYCQSHSQSRFSADVI
jgi:hypothetical protein